MPSRSLSERPQSLALPEQAWSAAVARRIGAARFGLWFAGQARFVRRGQVPTVLVRNQQTREWLEHTFGQAVQEAANETGDGASVRWLVDPAAFDDDLPGTTDTPPDTNSRFYPAVNGQISTCGHPNTTGATAANGHATATGATAANGHATATGATAANGQVKRNRYAAVSSIAPANSTATSKGKSNALEDMAHGDAVIPGKAVGGKTANGVAGNSKTANGVAGNSKTANSATGNGSAAAPVRQSGGGRGEAEWTASTPAATDLFGEPLVRSRQRRPVSDAAAEEPPSRLRRRWKTLDEFVVGPCNRVAYAAALSLVESPDDVVTPLVLYGPVGVGKTHLLEGIYAGLKRQVGQRPCYVTAEEFTTRFVAAAQHGRMAAFRRQYREATALLFDDLHFLASRKATQAEFLHTLDALTAEGQIVVVTMDCHPRLSDELMPELTDRLLGGAVWGLLPPDAETRLAILRRKAAGNGPPIPDVVLRTLANCLRGNVRELEGAVHSLRHYARVCGRPVDLAMAREALGDLLRHAVRVVTLTEVDAAVCEILRLTPGTLQSSSRAWAVTHPRMVAIYLCRKHTAATYSEISRHFGAKTHSTAVAAEKKVRQWLERDAVIAIGGQQWNIRDLIERIERQLQR